MGNDCRVAASKGTSYFQIIVIISPPTGTFLFKTLTQIRVDIVTITLALIIIFISSIFIILFYPTILIISLFIIIFIVLINNYTCPNCWHARCRRCARSSRRCAAICPKRWTKLAGEESRAYIITFTLYQCSFNDFIRLKVCGPSANACHS
jgi:hypothetical protein